MSNSLQPHRRQPTRLPHPWDSPGKNTGVGCHFLLQCMKVKSESEVAQSFPTPSDRMDCSLPAPPSMGFSRQEYWSGVPSPSPSYGLLRANYSIFGKKHISSNSHNSPVRLALKVKVLAAQSCLTLCNPMDYSPPSSSVYGIFQTRILGRVAIPFSRGSSRPRD